MLFRGTLHRAGLPGEEVAASVEVESRSEGRLDIPVDAALAERFSASGGSGHATFRGEVSVTFPPGEAGAAALAGKTSGVVLDVRAGRAAAVDARAQGAAATVELLGIELGGVAAASGGLVVRAVREGSPASGAGLLPQDVIVDFDGLRVSSAADLIPTGDTNVQLAVRRDGAQELRALTIPLDGVGRRIPQTLAMSGALVGAASLFFALSMRRPTAATAVVERRLAARLRALGARRGAEVRAGWRATWAVLAGDRAVRPSLDAVLFTAGCAAVGCAAPMFAPDLDVVTLSLGSIAGASALALAGGASLRAFVTHGAAALAVFTAIVTSGAFRVADLLRAQGALPWEWLAFRTPATLASIVVWGLCAASISADGARDGAGRPQPARPLPVERATVAVSAALATALFFGGWRVPGARTIEHGGWALSAMGATWYVVKAWLAWATIDVVRGMLPLVAAKGRPVTLLLPLALLAPLVAASAGAVQARVGVGQVSSWVTFGATMVVLACGALRIASALERIDSGHVDPTA